MSNLKRAAKNSVINMTNNILTKVLSLILIIVLARYLGAENYGRFSFILSFAGLFAVFGNFGLSLALRRNISRDKNNSNFYFFNSLMLALIFNLITFCTIMVIAVLLGYESEIVQMIFLGALIVVFQNVKVQFKSAYEAFEKMQYVLYTRGGKIIFRLILVLLLIFFRASLVPILWGYVVVEFLFIFLDVFIYHKNISHWSFKVDFSSWKGFVKKAIPFGIAGVFMTIYDKIDITMLSKLISNPDLAIGFYSSAYEFMSSLSFIAMSISGALAPIAYRAFIHDIDKLRQMFKLSFKLFLSLSVPLAVGGTILADKIIIFIYGDSFYGAILALKILIWAVIFNFSMFALGLALNSMNLEKETMKATILSVIFNVVANAILIPIYGYLAAGVTTVVSVFVYFIYCFRITQKRLVKINFLRLLIPIASSSIIMGVVLFYLVKLFSLHLVFLLVIGFVCYIGFLYLLGGVDKELLSFVKRIRKN